VQDQGGEGGEAGVMAALRSSLAELEAELGPGDANVQELRAILDTRGPAHAARRPLPT
jgi:hypothetical protein